MAGSGGSGCGKGVWRHVAVLVLRCVALAFRCGPAKVPFMRLPRPIAAFVLAFLLLVTSQSMAVARGTMVDATGTMVLCTGTGPITVLMDENGDPIGPRHICPDCALSVIAGLAEAFVLSTPDHAMLRFAPVPAARHMTAISLPNCKARDPPLV